MVLNFNPKLSARSDSFSNVSSIESLVLGRIFLSKMLNFKPKIPYIVRRKLKEHPEWGI